MTNDMMAREQIAWSGMDRRIIFKGNASNHFNSFVGSWLISKTYGEVLILVTTIIIGTTTVAGTTTIIITISILCLIDLLAQAAFEPLGIYTERSSSWARGFRLIWWPFNEIF